MNSISQKDGCPLVSISCITYNHAPYIRQCLDGFMMQKTNFAFEVLIHDDASTDGTTEIIKEYETRYPDIIKPLYEEENQWVKGRRGSAVFNFPRAKGKYIAMCEGDDYWIDPLKLQKQVDFLEDNPEYGMIYGNSNRYYETKHKIEKCSIETNPYNELAIDELLKHNVISTLTVCFRKTLFNEYINDRDIVNQSWLMGDYPLWLWIASTSKIIKMNDVVGIYRILDNSAAHSLNKKTMLRFYLSTLSVQRFFIYKNKMSQEIYDQASIYTYIHFLKKIYVDLKQWEGIETFLPLLYRNKLIIYHFDKALLSFRNSVIIVNMILFIERFFYPRRFLN